MERPAQETKIDLTKPYDPTSTANIPNVPDAKVEKTGNGKEKIKVGGKEYDCTWQKMKVKATRNGIEFEANATIWMAKAVPLSGVVKMAMQTKLDNADIAMTMELKEFGGK